MDTQRASDSDYDVDYDWLWLSVDLLRQAWSRWLGSWCVWLCSWEESIMQLEIYCPRERVQSPNVHFNKYKAASTHHSPPILIFIFGWNLRCIQTEIICQINFSHTSSSSRETLRFWHCSNDLLSSSGPGPGPGPGQCPFNSYTSGLKTLLKRTRADVIIQNPPPTGNFLRLIECWSWSWSVSYSTIKLLYSNHYWKGPELTL